MEEVTDDTIRFSKMENDTRVSNVIVYGLCVWAAGNAPLDISLDLIKQQGESEASKTGRIQVDTHPYRRLLGHAPISSFIPRQTTGLSPLTPPHEPQILDAKCEPLNHQPQTLNANRRTLNPKPLRPQPSTLNPIPGRSVVEDDWRPGRKCLCDGRLCCDRGHPAPSNRTGGRAAGGIHCAHFQQRGGTNLNPEGKLVDVLKAERCACPEYFLASGLAACNRLDRPTV